MIQPLLYFVSAVGVVVACFAVLAFVLFCMAVVSITLLGKWLDKHLS